MLFQNALSGDGVHFSKSEMQLAFSLGLGCVQADLPPTMPAWASLIPGQVFSQTNAEINESQTEEEITV